MADLFVFPSLYEGFGLPILESLACQTPVICSDNSSLPEVGQDYVGYFDAKNVEEMKERMEEYIERKYTKKELEAFRRYALLFGWDKSSAKTKEVISDVIKKN